MALTLNFDQTRTKDKGSFTYNYSGARIASSKHRYETLNGKQYLVVPMVMLTEGVHKGSSGPLYYPKDELSKTPVVWNTKPLVIYHPQQNGRGVSACSPEILETRSVGMVMNTHFNGPNGKLKAEAWFDESKLKKVDKRVWDAIQNNKKVEVSTGLFTDNVSQEGTWNGEKYVAVARNYRPDHLAILPDQKGACSIADGAGLLQNAQAMLNNEGEDESFTEKDQEILLNYANRWPAAKRHKLPGKDFAGPHESFPIKTDKDVMSAVKLAHHAKNPAAVMAKVKRIAKRKGLRLPPSLQDKTTTNASPKSPFDAGHPHSAVRKAITEQLRGRVKTAMGMTGPGGFVHDVYKDFFIGSEYQNGQERYYMQPYEMEPQSGTYTGADPDKSSAPLKVRFTGTPTEVKQVTSWKDMQGKLIANSEETERLQEAQEEAKQNFINELKTLGFKSRGELVMLQRKSVDDLALLVQRVHMQNKGILNQDSAGAGAAASTGGVPAGGSMNPGAKLFAQRKASAPAAKKGKKKRKKEMVY